MAGRWVTGSLLAGFCALGMGTVVAQQATPPAPPPVDAAAAKRGESLFQGRGCVGCHSIGKGKRAGPDLAGVTERRDRDWLRRWLTNPTPMLETDSAAKALLGQFNNMKMPNLMLKGDEIEAILQYIQQESAKAHPPS